MVKKASKIAMEARIACEKWRSYFKQNIDEYHVMHEFILSQQWTQDEQDEMVKTYRKVPLTSSKLGVLANYVLGEQQQNTPQLQVVPMDNCTEEVAYLRELITKDTMFSTDAKTETQKAFKQGLIGGFSAFMVDTEYSHDNSFEQNIVYRSFKDATRAYFDIGAETESKTDGMFCGVLYRLTREKFRDKYGSDIEERINNMGRITPSKQEIALAVEPIIHGAGSTDPFNWADDEGITINDYFRRKPYNDTIYRLSNGRNVDKKEMDEIIEKSARKNQQMMQPGQDSMGMEMQSLEQDSEMQGQNEMVDAGMHPQTMNPMQFQNEMPDSMTSRPEIMEGLAGPKMMPEEPEENEYMSMKPMEFDEDYMTLYDGNEPVRIEDTRNVKRYKIIRYLIAGDYILDKSEFPSEDLPIVFLDMNSWYDKNGKQMTKSFFQDVKDTQRYINYLRTQSAYILKISRYDQWIGSKKNVQGLETQQKWATPSNTQGILTYDESPSGIRPEQIRPPELPVSLFQQYQLAMEDLYTSTGIYPTQMGQQGNEISGAAIDARTRQGSYATFSLFTAINRAYAASGEIVNQMIPRVYDSERVMTLMTSDSGLKNITINKQKDEYGELIENDIRKGSWQVRLLPGPSYEGQKQQALDSLQLVLQNNPSTFNLLADLYADNLPLPNTVEIKNRLKTLVPQEILEAGKTGEMPHQAQNPDAMRMAQEQQMHEKELQIQEQEIQIKQQEIELKYQQAQMEMQMQMQKLETERLEVAAKLEEQKLRYLAETDRTRSDNAIAHADNMTRILTAKHI